MENKIILLNKKNNLMQKESNLEEKRIQSLMNELSICKETKIKYINPEINDFKVINKEGVELKNGDVNLVNRVPLVTNIVERKISFSPPKNIIGECKTSDINRVFHNLKPYLIKCFKQNDIKSGEIKFSWIINEQGDTTLVKKITENIYNKRLSSCLVSILQRGRYNSPKSGICTVSYSFKL